MAKKFKEALKRDLNFHYFKCIILLLLLVFFNEICKDDFTDFMIIILGNNYVNSIVIIIRAATFNQLRFLIKEYWKSY